MMRGVRLEFLRRGAKASTVRKGPVELVWKHCAICEAGDPEGQPRAALLTSTSNLKTMVSLSFKKLRESLEPCSIPAMLAFDLLSRG